MVEAGVAAPSSPDGHAAAPAAGNASAALAGLQVKGRAPKTGYARDEFGRRWADIDRDGCDQRNQVLARDMDRETFKAGTRDCVVLTGSLRDSYTATTISFTRGQGTSDKVQIDHVVALSDAWQKGAQQLDEATRERIGNDPLNLVAVDGPTNGRKGDGDAATWLPPDRGYRCAYVARQVAVKTKYRLWVTAAERDAIDRVLRTCPDRSVPTEADAAKPAVSLR
ncbi:lipoprotein [Pseudonocardia sp. EC080625-04]|nr:lipoprotein [Pseudonocardia sp. EC080625-04]